MKTTGNLGLKKPDGTDIVDITDLNGNMDILDTAVKAAQDHAADAVKHITAAERTAWNAKASTAVATTTAAGLMAGADKSKLDSVAQGANNYVHPNHTGDVTSSSDGVTAIAPGVIVNADVNASAGIDASKIGTGVVSNAEFGYLDGVTGNVQSQLDNRPQLNSNNTFTNNQKIISTAGINTSPALSIEGVTFNAALQIKNTTPSTGKRYSLYSYNGGDFAIVNETDAYAVAQVDGASKVWMIPGGVKSPNVPNQTTADITYYVRTDGNDGNTGLGNTAGGAFKTIGRAVNAIPKMANHTVNINVAAGSYAEAVVITGFVTSDLFALTASGNVSVTSIEVNNSHGVFVIKGFTATSTTAVGAFKVSASRRVVFESCVVTTQSAQAGLYVSASDVFVDRCNVSNRGNAVVILAECVAYASNNTGVNNGAAYLSGFASYFGYSGTVPAGNMVAQDGGMLVPGMGVLNPWGDNNTQSRTGAAGGSTAAQNMVSNTMTKLVYNGKYFDYLNEWNPATGTFTPSRTGMYTFDILCSLQGVPDGVVISLHMFKNGAEDQCIGRNTNSGSSVSVTSGHVTTDLTAGQPVSIYLHQSHSSGLSTTGSNLYNWFRVARVS
ncbi:C1q-like domain-containing protein [Paenibacillus silagei]|uniref:C1q domain-containing protein n=1 Tax=Paenibacillus silagei TaxID=1670801 RepID=A0ABS4P3I2_9BACL|nr:hypothetical protein [Paenibacillus silagei]MBP2116259.1 hypothetical protein [Paenibacillus silagei]